MATSPSPLSAAELKEVTPAVVRKSKSIDEDSLDELHAADYEEAHSDLEQQAAPDTNPTLERTKSMEYPPFKAAVVIMLSIYLTVFLVALDRTIIGTAVPSITNDFHSFDDIGWYASSYQLTTCGFQLIFGKIYTYYSPKWMYLSAIALFEIGSAICGAAPSSNAFIVGRAISGLGTAGIFSGAMVIIMNVLPLEKRPVWLGLNGAVFGVASVIGPLLGGVFTSYVSWRWCFYINLPIGAVTAVIVILVLKVDSPMAAAGKSTKEKMLQLDPLGTLCFLPAIVCLLLALQWGGSKYPWNNARVIALLVVFCVLIIAFIVLQVVRKEDHVTVKPRIIMQRSIASGVWFNTCMGGALTIVVYYIPIWFQAIKGVDAVQSGIRSIPLVLGLVVVVILTGITVGRIGYYAPSMILSSTITPIGMGLLTTFKVDTGHAAWIGYQVLAGAGMGSGMQQPAMAAQTVLPRKDVSTGMALMFFGQSLGGSVFIAVAQNILDSKLISNIEALNIPGFSPDTVVNAGATTLRSVVPAAELQRLLVAYNSAIMTALYVAVALASASIIGAATMEWRSVKKGKQGLPKSDSAVEGKAQEKAAV